VRPGIGILAAAPALCPHPRQQLAFQMQVHSPDQWYFRCRCCCCDTVWTSPRVPDRILGLCWLTLIEGRCQVDAAVAQRVRSSSVQQAEQRLAKVAEESGSYPVSRDLATLTEEGHR